MERSLKTTSFDLPADLLVRLKLYATIRNQPMREIVADSLGAAVPQYQELLDLAAQQQAS